MKYTVNQILSLTNIPSQTLRIWREKLPPIQGRNGYKACFTAGDALALKVIQKLTGEIGIPVSRLVPIANELFSACQGGYWPVLEKSYLKFDLSNNVLETVPLKTSSSSINTSLLLLPISNEVAHLRTALMPESATNYSQQELHFPPTILAGGSKK